MALYGWAMDTGAGIGKNSQRGEQLLQQSKHLTARAYCTLFGFGMDEDDKEAFRLLSTECDTSDPHVQYLLGLCYQWGYGCKEDKAQAIQCYERAGSHMQASNKLATLLERQDSIADRRRAITLYRQGATQGDSDAQFWLGFRYEHGLPGVLEADIAQAKHWYSLAAEQGLLSALHRLDDLRTFQLTEMYDC
eukprot:TRINITY_DN5449_c0_g3_i6.p1 TRINITY_DN5449_c0_g3~~TRINITY_DN5449_c0_g3_i6.p1  ORF type:complete len:214 (-),score=47.69 TRINITY_DN5449_c0_g3_i6:147-722(-)